MTDDEDFRCSVGSRDDGEPLGGTAPTDTAFLFVEYPGAWGRQAVAESRLPEAVRNLPRRPGRDPGAAHPAQRRRQPPLT